MNYQITCACGNRFFVTEEQLGRHVTCPTCNRALIPLTAQPDPSPSPGAGTDAPGTLEPTRRCPFCGELILAIAKKCKHCGEFLDRTPTAPTAAPPTSPTAPAPGSPDEPIFDLRVSQWDNFWKYIICFTLFVIVTAVLWLVPYLKENYAVVGVPGVFVLLSFIAWFFYLSARNSRCIIRPNRIETEVGIFAKRIDAVDIIRVVDIDLKQSLLQRLLGVGTIIIKSNDPTSPELQLYLVPQARKVYKYLQDQVPIAQKQRGIVFLEK